LGWMALQVDLAGYKRLEDTLQRMCTTP
jgi:hypothetical protein